MSDSAQRREWRAYGEQLGPLQGHTTVTGPNLAQGERVVLVEADLVDREIDEMLEDLNIKVKVTNEDQHDPVIVEMHDVPREGDFVSFYHDECLIMLEVEKVVWPMFGGREREPTIFLHRERGYSDVDWSSLFDSIQQNGEGS